MEDIIKILESEPHIVFNETTKKYINPNTDWDNANLYFGMGGGSQELTSGCLLIFWAYYLLRSC